MESDKWWVNYPWRMVQTNLREIDMEGMDAKAFAKELQDYHATVVLLNAAGIIASYDTKLPFQKKSGFLHGDTLQMMIDECHRAGIRVIARCDFSKIHEDVYREHPQWAYRRMDGSELNYNGFVQTCVNSGYQQNKVIEILEELFQTHNFDGLFCNMSGTFVMDYDLNLYEPCHCETCTSLFRERFGKKIPDAADPRNPAFGKYIAFIGGCAKKQKQKMYKAVKAINSNVAINGFDYMRTECNQDVNHLPWVYDASSAARRIAGPGRSQVVDNASVAYMAFQYRHSCISPGLLELRQWQNLAYSGSTSLYILSTLGKHRDQSGIRVSGKVFDFYAKHESLYLGQKSQANVLLVEKPLMGRNDDEADGWVRALTEMHIPFDEIRQTELTRELLKEYQAVVLADIRFMSDEQAELLDDYVRRGGTIAASGETGCNDDRRRPRQEMAMKSLGIRELYERRKCRSAIFEYGKAETGIFTHLSGQGISNVVPWDEVIVGGKAEGAETCLHLIPDQPCGPPEICYPKETSEIAGLYRSSYGEGTGIYIPFFIGTFYNRFGYENSFAFLKDVMMNIAGQKSIAPDASPMCEITVSGKEDIRLIHLINTSGCFGNSFFSPVRMHDIVLEVDLPAGAQVQTLNGGSVTVQYREGNTKLVLDCLNMYEAILIKQEV